MRLDKAETTSGGGLGEEASRSIYNLKARLSEDGLHVLAQEALQRLSRVDPSSGRARMVDPEVLDDLTEALIAPSKYNALRIVRRLMAEGAGMEHLYLDYLTPAARRLGTWWEESRVSFGEVAVGTSRIYGIMMLLRRMNARQAGLKGRTAVFASVPGEDHVLGVQMAADLFRLAGWEVTIRVGLSHEDLVNEEAVEQCGLIGLSASGDRMLAALIRLVIGLRFVNPEAFILVGGNIVEVEPDIQSLTGADGIARDLPATIHRMERYLAA